MCLARHPTVCLAQHRDSKGHVPVCAELLRQSLAPDSSAEGVRGVSGSLLVVSSLAEKSGERKGAEEGSCLLLLVPAAHSIKICKYIQRGCVWRRQIQEKKEEIHSCVGDSALMGGSFKPHLLHSCLPQPIECRGAENWVLSRCLPAPTRAPSSVVACCPGELPNHHKLGGAVG